MTKDYSNSLNGIKLETIYGATYSYKIANNGSKYHQSCPRVSLLKHLSSYSFTIKEVSNSAVLISCFLTRSSTSRKLIHTQEQFDSFCTGVNVLGDYCHTFIFSILKDVSIDSSYSFNTTFNSYGYPTNHISFSIKDLSGHSIGSLNYSLLSKGGLGNPRILLYPTCVPYLLNYL